jgi:hypothetical protein
MEDSLKRLIEAVPPPPPEPESKPHIPLQCFHKDFNARCGSPALKGEYFCYFHNPKYTPARILIDPTTSGFELPPLNDRATIQQALTDISSRIARNTIDAKRAGLLLYSIQHAILNLTPHYLVHAAAAKAGESAGPQAAEPNARVPASRP